MYELTLEKFSGPLEKLLELIEDQKLDVNEVSMAAVTDDFLKYLDAIRKQDADPLSRVSSAGILQSNVADGSSDPPFQILSNNTAEGELSENEQAFRADLRLLADFIAVASRLIFLKSKYLLPNLPLTVEEEADIKDLETRLSIYRDLRPAFRAIAGLWREGHRAYGRPYFLGRGTWPAQGRSVFSPGAKTDAHHLGNALSNIFEAIKTYEREEQTIPGVIVTLEEKIQEVLARVIKEGGFDLKNMSGEQSRSEMIIVFLAVLHLAREQLVRLEQIGNFSDIMVKKK